MKLEDQKEEAAATSGGQENVTQKSDGSNEGDEKKATESTEGEKVKEEEKGTEEKLKNDENKKKDVAGPKKPDRTMDNSCQSRMFLPTAEVHLSVSVCYKNPGQKKGNITSQIDWHNYFWNLHCYILYQQKLILYTSGYSYFAKLLLRYDEKIKNVLRVLK